MREMSPEVVEKFRTAVAELNGLLTCDELVDDNVESQLRAWLDGGTDSVSWTYSDKVTPDEWFFITTLYGEMTLDGQRTHIRKYFPSLFVQAARRDIRDFVPNMTAFVGLRSGWMSKRLCRMGSILRERNLAMGDYTQELREIERTATPDDLCRRLIRLSETTSQRDGKP